MAITLSRRSLICNQAVPHVTGIDFVQVADPALQTELLVFFIVDPDLVVVQDGPPQVFMVNLVGPLPQPAANPLVTIAPAKATAAPLPEHLTTAWDRVTIGGTQRTVLRLVFSKPGGFYSYRLTVNHTAVDPLFNGTEFSFKQGCATGFDCAPDCACGPAEFKTAEIDYLARDFGSFNSALHDFTKRYYPRWAEHLTADAGSMMIDLLAALGDEFAYTQDRFAREAYVETATQRRSLERLSSLVDYRPDPGVNAAGHVSLLMAPAPSASLAIELRYAGRLAVWAVPQGLVPSPFELGNGLAADAGSAANLFVHHHWNHMALHLADASAPCLKAGAISLLLAPGAGNIALPRAAQISGSLMPEEFWKGRWMMLVSEPTDPAVEARQWPIRIVTVTHLTDPLILTNGAASQITKVDWEPSQALPHDMRIEETFLYGNVAPVTAGLTISERFRLGHDASTDPAIAELPRAVEREGMLDETSCERGVTFIHGLRHSETAGLSFTGGHNLTGHRVPEIELAEVDAFGATVENWLYRDSLLDADLDDPAFTIDSGMWRDIVRFQRNGEFIVHHDYAADAGYSLRFGASGFGRTPDADTLFKARFRSFHGEQSNLAAASIRKLDPPDGSPRHPALAAVADVINHLPVAGGANPETAASIRMRAPEYYRLFPMRAVRDEDYRSIAERLDWVQQAGARCRWTGSWLATFVTADPLDATSIDAARLQELRGLLDAVRQAGRDVIIRQPRFISLDIDITICVAPGFYGGQVREAVLAALSDETGFFASNRFTFGDPLRRSAHEAAVQAVPGVKGVSQIKIRPRHTAHWRIFSEPEYPVAIHELIRVDNNPAAPEHGVISVRQTEAAALAGSMVS